MPIKPENRAIYPDDWGVLSRDAKERAGWRCAHAGCTARQYAVGHWIRQGVRETWVELWCEHDAEPEPGAYGRARQRAAEHQFSISGDDPKPHLEVIVIVLTTAHLNHDPSDCRPQNLAPLCQRHHLQYDAKHHAETAYMTRRARANTDDLFGHP
jgi:hypothetical protein